MNCQEVTELMHRQLDDDLRESEMEVLLNHTRHCPDCAAMFERLTRLSAELTSLPKVTPSYSLVDAIMPELLRIDNDNKAVAASPASDAQSHARRVQRTRRWPSWKAISGVVAAGIVAGIFLITYPPQLGTMSDSDDAANIHTADGSVMKAPAREEASQFRSMNAGGDASSDSPESGSDMKDVTDQMGDKMEGNFAPDVYNYENAPSDVEPTLTGSQEGSTEGGQGESGSLPNMGIAAQALFPSPNEHYVASIDGHSVVISAADGSQLFKTESKNGDPVNLLWSPESNELTYEVSLEQGATEKYIIDIQAQAERKAE